MNMLCIDRFPNNHKDSSCERKAGHRGVCLSGSGGSYSRFNNWGYSGLVYNDRISFLRDTVMCLDCIPRRYIENGNEYMTGFFD